MSSQPIEILKYEVEILDTKGSVPDFHLFNFFYKKGKWKRFWELLNFKTDLHQHPEYFIIQNFHLLRQKHSKLGNQIDDLVILYNHKLKNYHYILYDFHNQLIPKEVHSLFLDKPAQFGLRGDPELWEDLGNYFKGKPFPENEQELIGAIQSAIIELTGKAINESESIFVEKYYHGSGMSGGVISSGFWLRKAIPMLIGRYKRLQEIS